MVVTLERLGVLASFSRPGVSNDNPYSEALFRTLKYCPAFRPSPSPISPRRACGRGFVRWYNTEHLHSAIRFVTPRRAPRRARHGAAPGASRRLRAGPPSHASAVERRHSELGSDYHRPLESRTRAVAKPVQPARVA
jgi:hypothetical protein